MMNKFDINAYKKDGYFFPLKALENNKIEFYLSEALKCLNMHNLDPEKNIIHKTYILQKWANNLIREKLILDNVRNIIGDNIFCYS